METQPPDPNISTDVPDPSPSSITKPLELHSKPAGDIFDLLDIPEDKRLEIVKCSQQFYKGCDFPNVAFTELPKNDVRAAATKLKTELCKIYPGCRKGEPWFARWALWWEHTEPIPPPTTAMSNQKADDIYNLLRASYRTRINIIQCTGKVYTDAGFQDVRFSKLPKDKVEEVVMKLTIELRKVFPDSRRGEPWFARWALWRRHKTRPESRKKGRGKSAPDLGGEDEDDDEDEDQDEEG